MRELRHYEAAELLGAYALDAVDGEEREVLERHVGACPTCREELSEHRETAAFLGPTWTAPPEGVWDRISGTLEESPPVMQPPAVPPVVPLAGRPRRAPLRLGLGIAAASIVAVLGVVSLKIVDQDRRMDRMETEAAATDLEQAISEARADPSARRIELKGAGGELAAEALVLADGRGYLVPARLPVVGPERTYQLWALVGSEKISVGVLGHRPGPSAFSTAPQTGGLAITEEPAGGVVATEEEPVGLGFARSS